ncbi:S-(hydroxymethyl)glutathione dehydrogenase/alcohol dehydrogenase [Geodermatophilus normandii]|uniref:S-(Hydroxymethyl)glutathione dehydrogenase/alcohol dehydrogenase n=1 Tax=Geodermatophilus normandii TaxID=1137989 RepID=A0A317QI46_9ACTN|nr:NDMA-dependent alcohol dehydrogenase [Geodermatophilus normandii]PWW22336.1 S-(hydroxymethyl)glutathione dehydrogenase/alcohol dehydrogenase [Geodermatophilus normandii]
MKTKGAILWGVGEEWSIEEIELGDPKAGEVQVQLAASGLCHSDEHLVTGGTPVAFYPVIGGHEGSGVVTKVGPGVTGLQEGDHVVTAFIPACGQCPPCSKGMQNLCDLGASLLAGTSISDGTYRVQARGQDVIPMCLLGTFSPYITVHQASVVKIEPDIPLEIAALVGCGVTTGWGSATKVADVRPGENVVVMGAGGVGMNAVQGAAAAGAKRVMVIDPVARKREWAMELGATHTFESAEEATEKVNELTWGRMADKTIITVGDIQGEDVQAALTLTGKGGRAVVTGMGNAANTDVKLSLFELTLLQKDLQGAIFGGLAPRAAIPELLSLYQEGQLKLDELATTKYKLEDINQGYQDMRDGKNIRGMVVYSDSDR